MQPCFCPHHIEAVSIFLSLPSPPEAASGKLRGQVVGKRPAGHAVPNTHRVIDSAVHSPPK